MEIEKAISEAGVLYLYTGRERFAEAFKAQLIKWLGNWLAREPYLHGANDDLWRIVIAWDLLEEAPVFDDDERLWITRKLWELLKLEHSPYEQDGHFNRRNYNYFRWLREKDKAMLRGNHMARFASSYFFGGRYFYQYYHMPEATHWLEEVRAFWGPQMTTYAAEEATSSMAYITLSEATNYALANRVESFLSRDVLGVIADKGLAETAGADYLGGWLHPLPFWALAAHHLKEPKYLQPICPNGLPSEDVRLSWTVSWEMGRSFWDGRVPPEADATSDWVVQVPLARFYYDHAVTHGPETVPYAQVFDMVAFKDPLGRGEQYLSIGGHNTGSYSEDIANAIKTFVSHGLTWLKAAAYVATIRKHNAVSVVRNGTGHPLPSYARLERIESTAEWGMSRTTLVDYNGTDWHRNVFNVPRKWFLVVDELVAREPSEYVLEARWNGRSPGGFDGEDFCFLQEGPGGRELALRLIGGGWNSQYVIPWRYSDYLASPMGQFPVAAHEMSIEQKASCDTMLVRRWSGSLGRGERHTFVHLFYVHPRHEDLPYRLKELNDRQYLVEGVDEAWQIGLDTGGQWYLERVDTSPTYLAAEAAQAPSAISRMTSEWQARETARILSATSAWAEGASCWAVGLADGRIQVMTQDGEPGAIIEMPGMVFALTAIDLDGNGDQELVAGSDTGGVRAFTTDGREVWSWSPPAWRPNSSWRQSFGEQRTTITHLTALDIKEDEPPGILACGLYFYVLDSRGNLISMYSEADEIGFTDVVGTVGHGLWRTPENELILAVGDARGDGRPLIFGDVSCPTYRHVRFWDPRDGRRLAHFPVPPKRYLGNAHKTATAGDFNGDGGDEFAMGSDAFVNQLSVYSLDGGLLWHRDLGGTAEIVKAADLDGDGKAEILAGTEMGYVQAFDGTGTRLFLADAGGPVVSMTVVTGRTGKQIWAGTLNGTLLVLDAEGSVLRRAESMGYVDHLAVGKGAVLATTAEGRVAQYAIC